MRHPTSLRLPPCPFKAMTGLECPGCGSTRAAHHALNGRVGSAWRHNPAMMLVGLPALALLFIDLFATIVARRRMTIALRPPPA